MKRKFNRFAALTLCLSLSAGLLVSSACAADGANAAAATTGTVVATTTSTAASTRATDVRVTVNDTLVEFIDAQPYIDENNRTMIPVRFVTETMGADVSWDDNNKTAIIVKDGIEVRLTNGNADMTVIENGETRIVTMDTASVIKNSRTYVPIRYVAEALGAYVDYSNLYNVVEIVTSDELTAEDIERLRSYDLIQWYHTNNVGDEWFTEKTEYKYFTGDYWFSNSHNFLRLNDTNKLTYKAKSLNSIYYCDVGTDAYTFMTFCMKYVDDKMELELGTINEETGEEIYEAWTYHKDGWLDVTYNFRTNTNLVYQMVCPPLACISVRGVLDITCGEDTPKQWITDSFGIENPEYGVTYSLDVEFIVAVDTFYYVTDVAEYYFDSDGVAHELDKQPVVNYH